MIKENNEIVMQYCEHEKQGKMLLRVKSNYWNEEWHLMMYMLSYKLEPELSFSIRQVSIQRVP